MLRISEAAATGREITLRLEGEIIGRWVEELRKACDLAWRRDARDDRRLVLDMAGVSSIDSTGLALFRELTPRPIVVTNCSAYVAELLRDVGESE